MAVSLALYWFVVTAVSFKHKLFGSQLLQSPISNGSKEVTSTWKLSEDHILNTTIHTNKAHVSEGGKRKTKI